MITCLNLIASNNVLGFLYDLHQKTGNFCFVFLPTSFGMKKENEKSRIDLISLNLNILLGVDHNQ